MTKTSTKTLAPWGDKHKAEACGRGFELMAEAYRASGWSRAHGMLMGSAVNCERESTWRKWLARNGFDAARIDREVARVRALADGRLVRETFYGVRLTGEATVYRRSDLTAARVSARGAGGADAARVVHVTRIRRAS